MNRISQLPNRPLVLDDAVMEFAHQDERAIYLVTYVPRQGAPDDPTKRAFDVSIEVLNLTTGAAISPTARRETHTVYSDPSGAIQTQPDDTPAQQILANVSAICTRMQGWAAVLLDPTPLHEQLAP